MRKTRIAITGGIGSGKSYVCKLLKMRGYDVYDCDSAAKRIMCQSAEVRQKLIKEIGSEAYNGEVPNKARIRSFILSSVENMKIVNSIVHPVVADDFQQSGTNLMECAILFSSGFYKLVDRVVCVSAPLEVKLERIMQRDKISREKAMSWIACQMPQKEMESRSDFIIYNDGNRLLDEQVDKMLTMFGMFKL